jgi:hypothetical protein
MNVVEFKRFNFAIAVQAAPAALCMSETKHRIKADQPLYLSRRVSAIHHAPTHCFALGAAKRRFHEPLNLRIQLNAESSPKFDYVAHDRPVSVYGSVLKQL